MAHSEEISSNSHHHFIEHTHTHTPPHHRTHTHHVTCPTLSPSPLEGADSVMASNVCHLKFTRCRAAQNISPCDLQIFSQMSEILSAPFLLDLFFVSDNINLQR